MRANCIRAKRVRVILSFFDLHRGYNHPAFRAKSAVSGLRSKKSLCERFMAYLHRQMPAVRSEIKETRSVVTATQSSGGLRDRHHVSSLVRVSNLDFAL